MPAFANEANPSFKENYILDEINIDNEKSGDGNVALVNGASMIQSRYWRLAMPLISDRDNALIIQVKKLDERLYGPGSFYILGVSNDSIDVPKKDGIVRMYQYISGLC